MYSYVWYKSNTATSILIVQYLPMHYLGWCHSSPQHSRILSTSPIHQFKQYGYIRTHHFNRPPRWFVIGMYSTRIIEYCRKRVWQVALEKLPGIDPAGLLLGEYRRNRHFFWLDVAIIMSKTRSSCLEKIKFYFSDALCRIQNWNWTSYEKRWHCLSSSPSPILMSPHDDKDCLCVLRP